MSGGIFMPEYSTSDAGILFRIVASVNTDSGTTYSGLIGDGAHSDVPAPKMGSIVIGESHGLVLDSFFSLSQGSYKISPLYFVGNVVDEVSDYTLYFGGAPVELSEEPDSGWYYSNGYSSALFEYVSMTNNSTYDIALRK